mgnify:CR=1 FL=1
MLFRSGRPSPALVVQICEYFHLIWDDYEDLHRRARVSHPRVVVDTRGLTPLATEAANLLADRIAELDVNPLICRGERIVAVDGLVVMGTPGTTAMAAPR